MRETCVPPQYLSYLGVFAACAQSLGLSLRIAYEVMDYPDFPLIKIGRCKRVERDEFFEWLEQQTLNKIK
jgi:hypothetical protein